MTSSDATARLARAIESGDVLVGVIGLGYVGLPLVQAFAARGIRVVGFDIDPAKVERLRAGRSYIRHIGDAAIAGLIAGGLFSATADFSELANVDAILICVPTPLTRQREPDLSYVEGTARRIARFLRPGHLVVLESTTYPGTCEEVVRPILEGAGLRSGAEFFLAYSPEREDPGNAYFDTASIPKVVGGDGPEAAQLAGALYGRVVASVVPVSSLATAEAVKLTENVFRAVNIALVNELKVVYGEMGIDVWEVIAAASTKPFGYMPFHPGPGLGGHCVPIDPFYLTWKAREYGVATRFIELAGEINTAMPRYVIERLALALDRRFAKGLRGSRILVVGVAYKKNVDDVRESPALRLMQILDARGAEVAFHDPHVPAIPQTREYPGLKGRASRDLDAGLDGFDAALICTDHDGVDYARIVAGVPLIVDTRNVCERLGLSGPQIVKA